VALDAEKAIEAEGTEQTLWFTRLRPWWGFAFLILNGALIITRDRAVYYATVPIHATYTALSLACAFAARRREWLRVAWLIGLLLDLGVSFALARATAQVETNVVRTATSLGAFGVLFMLWIHTARFSMRVGDVWLVAGVSLLLHTILLWGYGSPVATVSILGLSYVVGASIAHFGVRRAIALARNAALIATERARSEAQLKQEISHQVAERSKELGAAIARSEISLDARKLAEGEHFAERYRVVRPLGMGGMGAVYEVARLTDDRRLALKAITGDITTARAARFAREAEIGARVHHENLVGIVDVGIAEGVPFLVMELVSGGSLEDHRARFGDRQWALPILRQIAAGLAALHTAGVVHRDLKPANVLLSDNRNARISDFGISRFGVLDDGSVDAHAQTQERGLTGTGAMLGTPMYMAPEAAGGGRAVDASADVFAFGIIAYELLTGKSPFAVPPVILALTQQPLPPVAPTEGLSAEILACLDRDPTRRPSIVTVAAAL
jgi:hypothetical protein